VSEEPIPTEPDELETILRQGADALGVPLDDKQVGQLLGYLANVLEWNQKINVTAVRSPKEAVVRHLVDSLSIVPVWHALNDEAPPGAVLDLGTGGGFPGAPLAIAWPTCRALLIDGTGKKIKVVADSLEVAGVANAEAFQSRAEQLHAHREDSIQGYDLCVARAVGPAPRLLHEFRKLVAPGGTILLMKGAQPTDDELAAANDAARKAEMTPLPHQQTGMPGGDRGTVLAFRCDAAPINRPPRRRDARRNARHRNVRHRDRQAGDGGRPGPGSEGSSRAR
jgi:16S rRNA (guanine527-N7)-methyltransferase